MMTLLDIIVWDGMDLIGLAVLGVLAVIWIILKVCLYVRARVGDRQQTRWERTAKKEGDDQDGNKS